MSVRIESFWEIMQRFDAWGIAILLRQIDENKIFAQKMCDLGSRDDQIDKELKAQLVEPIITIAAHHAKDLHLQSTKDRVWPNMPFMMAAAVGLTWQQAVNELTVLRQAIEADLEKHIFTFIAPAKAQVIVEPLHDEKWKMVVAKFPQCTDDVWDAHDCYAMGKNTACVFHMMRVAEHGLRGIAKKVRVSLIDKGKRQPIEYATWDKVINSGIKPKLLAAHALPQGPKKTKYLQFYSDVAEQCTYIRDLWRNEVSHTRKSYNDGEALGVLHRVRDFMYTVASGLRQK